LWVIVFSILPNNPKKIEKAINPKPTKQKKPNPKNKKVFLILSNRCTKKIKDVAKVVEKTKTSRKRKKHKLSCKKTRKKKKRMINDVCPF
jgi:hypothetical protein